MKKTLASTMAKSKITTLSLLILFNLMCLILTVSAEEERKSFVDEKLLPGAGVRKEKLSHFRFYWHDTLKGPNASAVTVVNPPSQFASKSGFGTVNMIDNPLTEKPDLTSKLLGRAQGFYAVASREEVSLLMAMNFVFVQGKYNGSTFTVFGRNSVFNNVREMPVIAGTGLFRFARGYAQATTYSFDTASGNAVVEYNVYLLHY